ncbi:hypothetical protein ACG7TL_008414 [Trametes sanguinea]
MPALDPHRLAQVIPGFAEADIPHKRLSLDQCSRLGTLLGLGRGTEAQAIGVSLRLSEKGAITSVAFATEALVVQINTQLSKSSSGSARTVSPYKGIADTLSNSRCLLVGVGMQRIALLLRHQLQANCMAVDLPMLFSNLVERGLPSPGEIAQEVLSSRAHVFKINALWHYQTNDNLCLRAWLTACIGSKSSERLEASAKLRTEHLRVAHIECLAVVAMNVELLEAKKPTKRENEFSRVDILKGRKLLLHNARYQTRVRKSRQTIIQINNGAMEARAFEAKGRRTELQIIGGRALASADIVDVRVLGREEATSSELARDEYLSDLLEEVAVFDDSTFNRLLWFPDRKNFKRNRRQATDRQFDALNASQRIVASAMIDEKEQLVITHGPPGTGKTTTIAAALDYWQVNKKPVWVIAQSNVGVKNIARSIIKRGIKFKLLVSKEFHFEWHEHLYKGSVEDTIIRSERFFTDFDPVHEIGDAQIILCTLAMLSNPQLAPIGMFAHRPMERLVVDEASQIDVSEFMHLFGRFEELRKVCMFGDPKQLPPFGKEHAPKMQTIFDFPHIRKGAYFLDTQYRMPVPLGDFISQEVYKSLLKSDHEVQGRDCIKVIDVRKGVEEQLGTSWKNMEEAHTVVNLVKHYYRRLKFCIITPYDAQRATITNLLKGANLPSDVVYNVDSFQGTQVSACDVPLVSVADNMSSGPNRTRSPNRVNVMLTRCQQGMILVTQRQFVHGGGKHTLLGKLVKEWEDAAGTAGGVWVDAMEVAGRRANLPGAPGRR